MVPRSSSAALLALLLAFGCSSTERPSEGTSARPVEGWEVFGAELPEGRALTLEELLSDPERHDGREVLVEASIESVCAVKGCWMVLAGEGGSVRVRFRDYAFFVPLDAAGASARVHGVFRRELLSLADARHYLEDAGRHDEARALSGPVEELSLVADAVRLRRP